MLFETNKDKERAGLASAIGYFGTHGYTVSLPLNNTQDYDLIVDNGSILRVSVKATGQKTPYGVSVVSLRNMRGAKGKVYSRECDKSIDYVFVVNEKEEKWLLPKEVLQRNSICLGSRYEKYKLSC